MTGLTLITSLPAPVTEFPAQPMAPSLLRDTGSMLLLMAGMVAVMVCYGAGYRYIDNLFHNMTSARRRENLFEDHGSTAGELPMVGALMLNLCVTTGFMLYFAITTLAPAATLTHPALFVRIAALSGVALVFYTVQALVYLLLGYVFSDGTGTRLWVDGFISSQALLGLLLAPLVLLILAIPAWTLPLLAVGTALYAAMRIVFIYKGFRIFYSNLPSLLYFLLYLCAVEIVPLVFMKDLTIRLCEIIHI